MPTKRVQWTAELSGVDFFSDMAKYEAAGIDLKQANDRYAAAHKTAEDPYPVLKLTYYDTCPEEGQSYLRQISYEEWKTSPGRYECPVDTNWVMNPDEAVQAELDSKLEWLGYLSNHCEMDDIMNMAIWCTSFRSVVTPYDGTITFWYFESERYKDSFNLADIAERGPISTDELVDLIHEYTDLWSRGEVATVKD